MADHLFVYGSLLPALAPPEICPLIAGLRCLGPATTTGRLHDLGPYPGLVLDGGPGQVHGQVFELPAGASVLAELDAYEGYDARQPNEGLFVRVLRPVHLASGDELDAWVYVFQGRAPQAALILGGDYLAWRRCSHS